MQSPIMGYTVKSILTHASQNRTRNYTGMLKAKANQPVYRVAIRTSQTQAGLFPFRTHSPDIYYDANYAPFH